MKKFTALYKNFTKIVHNFTIKLQNFVNFLQIFTQIYKFPLKFNKHFCKIWQSFAKLNRFVNENWQKIHDQFIPFSSYSHLFQQLFFSFFFLCIFLFQNSGSETQQSPSSVLMNWILGKKPESS